MFPVYKILIFLFKNYPFAVRKAFTWIVQSLSDGRGRQCFQIWRFKHKQEILFSKWEFLFGDNNLIGKIIEFALTFEISVEQYKVKLREII